MSVYLSSHDKNLNEYLDRAHLKEREPRSLAPDEFNLVVKMHETKKYMNLCMTELMFTMNAIRRMDVRELIWIANNFNRIIHSLHSQRQLLIAVNMCFVRLKPKPEELDAINHLMKSIDERLYYLNSVPIPENIKLTPIQDYIDLLGEESFIKEVKNTFPASKDLFESQKNGDLDAYVAMIFDTLDKAGKADLYKPRLDRYIEICKSKAEKAKAEKKREKFEYAMNESQNGILLFRDLFFKGIRTLEGNADIGLSHQSISSHMKRGHRGKFCILCCGFANNKFVYRYVKSGGGLSASFQNVKLFDTMDEAKQTIVVLTESYPGKVFDAVAI